MKITNKELRDKYKSLPCEVCGSIPSDCDHILNSCGLKSREVELNCWSICRKCHTKKGTMGRNTFIKTFRLEPKLISRGFYFCEASNKWKHPDIS